VDFELTTGLLAVASTGLLGFGSFVDLLTVLVEGFAGNPPIPGMEPDSPRKILWNRSGKLFPALRVLHHFISSVNADEFQDDSIDRDQVDLECLNLVNFGPSH